MPTAAVDWGTGPVAAGAADRSCAWPASPWRRGCCADPAPALGLHGAARGGRCWSDRRRRGGRRPAGCSRCATSGQGDALVLRAGPARGGRRRRRARTRPRGRLPRPAGGHDGAAGGAHPLPRRPRRRARRGARRSRGRRGRGHRRCSTRGRGAARWRPRVGHDPGLASYGETRRVGDVTLQALWPRPGGAGGDPARARPTTPASCCSPRWRGVRILLTGDVEPSGAGGAGARPRRAAASTCSRCRTTAAATRTSTG